jgi:hypothetical protein
MKVEGDFEREEDDESWHYEDLVLQTDSDRPKKGLL